jgi:hypothetical protein
MAPGGGGNSGTDESTLEAGVETVRASARAWHAPGVAWLVAAHTRRVRNNKTHVCTVFHHVHSTTTFQSPMNTTPFFCCLPLTRWGVPRGMAR